MAELIMRMGVSLKVDCLPPRPLRNSYSTRACVQSITFCLVVGHIGGRPMSGRLLWGIHADPSFAWSSLLVFLSG